MKTLVIGLGKSGRAAYDLLLKEGGIVVGTDDNLDLLNQLGNWMASTFRLILSVEEFDRGCSFSRHSSY